MYNSYTVSVLNRLWRTINSFYKYSTIRKINDSIIRTFKKMLNGSLIANFMTNDESLIESSAFYKIYGKLISFIESLFNRLRTLAKQYKQGSILNRIGESIFESHVTTISTISLFIIAFSLVNIGIDAVNGNIKTHGNALLFIITVIFILVFTNRESVKEAVDNSLFIKLLKNIFTIDNGGDQWW